MTKRSIKNKLGYIRLDYTNLNKPSYTSKCYILIFVPLRFNGNISIVIVVYFCRVYPNMIAEMGHILYATEFENDSHKSNMPAEARIDIYCYIVIAIPQYIHIIIGL